MMSIVAGLVRSKRAARNVLLAFLWLAVAGVLFLVREALLPFVLAVLLAYVVNPLVSCLGMPWFGSKRLSRPAAVALVYVLMGALLTILGAAFLPRFYQEMVRLAKAVTLAVNAVDEESVFGAVRRLELFLHDHGLPIRLGSSSLPQGEKAFAKGAEPFLSVDLAQIAKDMLQQILGSIHNQVAFVAGSVQDFIAGVAHFLFKTLLVFMIAAFLLIDLESIKEFVFSLVPREKHGFFKKFLANVDRGLAGVVRGQLTICFVNGVLTLIGLLLLGIPFALVQATVAGVLSIVPIFGSIISTVPIAVIALTQSVLTCVLAVGWILLIHALEANFLNPKIMGHTAKMHPLLVIFALVLGEHFYGLVGALLAVPVASVLQTIFHIFLRKLQQLDAAIAPAAHSDPGQEIPADA
ncbi:MAG: AI-2E family transporter [Myxococcota bacterium]